MPKLVSILEFAYRIGFTNLYDWQARILLRYEGGEPTAAACANYSGKTSVVFTVAALWTLYNFPRARLMYMSATWRQVTNKFFAGLERFRERRMFAGCSGWRARWGHRVAVFCMAVPATSPVSSRASMTSTGVRPGS